MVWQVRVAAVRLSDEQDVHLVVQRVSSALPSGLLVTTVGDFGPRTI